jgi:hypothetical protein
MFIFVIVVPMESKMVASLVRDQSKYGSAQNCLKDSNFFDSSILSHKDQALGLWRKTIERYKAKEQKYSIPYALAEKPKLYAIDALVVAAPLVQNEHHLGLIAQFWNVFFLMVHYFDDHVEHRDKFYSKFHFRNEGDLNTQRGAAPFSFILTSLEILNDILDDLTVIDLNQREKIMRTVNSELIMQTQFFALERKEHISVSEVFKIKQLGVSGQTFGVLADLLIGVPLDRKVEYRDLKRGFMSLGSLIQITDDIRDISVDKALNNANIVTAAYESSHTDAADQVGGLYAIETDTLLRVLKKIYDKDELSAISALPFYPFMINKLELESEGLS